MLSVAGIPAATNALHLTSFGIPRHVHAPHWSNMLGHRKCAARTCVARSGTCPQNEQQGQVTTSLIRFHAHAVLHGQQFSYKMDASYETCSCGSFF